MIKVRRTTLHKEIGETGFCSIDGRARDFDQVGGEEHRLVRSPSCRDGLGPLIFIIIFLMN